ncbi:hypothetical protein BE61_83510 [Bradyrhizobium elkanii USDA 61]|nr:hypothetical protein BE61_83510 [Bradyrhizobium elkanii USDA 61]GEC51575.1 hypothetical protein BEL01nite_06180 [Bradyrhizobium elkanii]
MRAASSVITKPNGNSSWARAGPASRAAATSANAAMPPFKPRLIEIMPILEMRRVTAGPFYGSRTRLARLATPENVLEKQIPASCPLAGIPGSPDASWRYFSTSIVNG